MSFLQLLRHRRVCVIHYDINIVVISVRAYYTRDTSPYIAVAQFFSRLEYRILYYRRVRLTLFFFVAAGVCRWSVAKMNHECACIQHTPPIIYIITMRYIMCVRCI
uniref:Uncharacterized protein n=1 Tax=Schizaphis graminum TaxID=13262 RepID=A0A2S2P976_SCHGA